MQRSRCQSLVNYDVTTQLYCARDRLEPREDSSYNLDRELTTDGLPGGIGRTDLGIRDWDNCGTGHRGVPIEHVHERRLSQ